MKPRHQPADADLGGEADRQRTRQVGTEKIGSRPREQSKGIFDADAVSVASLRQGETSRQSLKQLHAQLFLQAANAMAHGARRDADRIRRTGEIAGPCHGPERLQPAQRGNSSHSASRLRKSQVADEIFSFAPRLFWRDSACMYRDFLNRSLPEVGRSQADRRSEARGSDLSSKLVRQLIPGPPGVADQVLWTLVLSSAGRNKAQSQAKNNTQHDVRQLGLYPVRPWLFEDAQDLHRFREARSKTPRPDRGGGCASDRRR